MESGDFGVWAMLAFWASAIGGIVFGISWARSRSSKSPVPKEILLRSLKQRLDAGELTREEYDRRVREIGEQPPSSS